MKICLAHGGDVSEPSGGTDRVTAIAAGLQDREFDVSLVVPEPANPPSERLDDVDVVPVATDRFGVQNAVARAMAISRTARSLAAERGAVLQLEHSSLAGIGTFGGCDGFVLDMHDIAYPRFEHVESWLSPVLKRGVKWIERRAVDRARHIVVVSGFMKRMLHDRWDVRESDITVVPNGYFPERLDGTADVEVQPGRICFLGTLHPKVDVETFERIANIPDVTEVVVIGDGAQRDRVDRLARNRSAIRATGRLPDREAFDFLASAQVVINPQIDSDLQRSSSPVKLFYYAGLGKPMVVTSGPSIVGKLDEADAALVADSRPEFIAHVDRLVGSEPLRRELARNAERLSTEFRWDARSDQIAAVHERRLTENE
jgi:glycosyltransferase involved in cell wall biosynthesis